MAAGSIVRLTHCTFTCKDYPKMVDFYENTMGLEKLFTINYEQDIIDGYISQGYPLKAKPGDEWITYLKIAPREFIELFNCPYAGDNDTMNQEFHHVCLVVKDIHEAAKELEDKGVTLWHGPKWLGNPFTRPYAQEGEPGQCGSLAFYVQDPEGNEIEVMQYTENSLQLKYDHD
ncbi:MAG TPA: VOC family protein [Candidatus Egerieimonas intestinavium]|uniref:VOC family protein n=1 Tax=Candidatus Egerieimonas intestinavium TaxID=2840777 RepID=A0A9D1EMD7_9FIRM|nr:VOC family protein [Candidatus Egerieimonas intestinavium]